MTEPICGNQAHPDHAGSHIVEEASLIAYYPEDIGKEVSNEEKYLQSPFLKYGERNKLYEEN